MTDNPPTSARDDIDGVGVPLDADAQRLLAAALDDEANEPNGEPDDRPPHPTWCDPECCEVRGNNTRGMFHRSAPQEIYRPEVGPTVVAWRACDASEPLNLHEVTQFVVVRFTDANRRTGEPETVITHWFPLPAALRLSMVTARLCAGDEDEDELPFGVGAALLRGGPGLSGPGAPMGGAS